MAEGKSPLPACLLFKTNFFLPSYQNQSQKGGVQGFALIGMTCFPGAFRTSFGVSLGSNPLQWTPLHRTFQKMVRRPLRNRLRGTGGLDMVPFHQARAEHTLPPSHAGWGPEQGE